MRTETRYCPHCEANIPHDVYTNIWNGGGPSSVFERVLFGVATMGFSESDAKFCRCQRCREERQI